MASQDAPGTDAPGAGTDSAVALIDALLQQIGDVIHDGPVQQLVAAKLLVESAMPAARRTELGAQAISSLTAASRQSRMIMWALARPGVRPAMAHVDVPQALAKLEKASITVDVPESVLPSVLRDVVQATHHLCGGSVMAGQDVRSVELTHSSSALSSRIEVDGGGPAAVWVELARRRMAAGGGAVAVETREATTVLTVHAPFAGPSIGQSPDQPG